MFSFNFSFQTIKILIFLGVLSTFCLENGFKVKNHPEIALPLKSLQNIIDINNGVAKVTLLQTYHNNYEIPLETEYLFPINPDAVFDGFQAKIGDKTLVGFIKEKKEAQSEYESNLKKGNTVAYSEIDSSAHDIMRINIGNLLPNQTIIIQYSYIEPLELVLNSFRRFTLHSTLTPRYTPEGSPSSIPIIKEIKPSDQTYKWDLKIKLSSSKEFTKLYSPSHKIFTENITGQNKSHSLMITLDSKESHDPNKDFVLLYQQADSFEPRIILERHPKISESVVASLSFFPKLNSLANEEIQRFLESKNEDLPLKSDIERAKGEFFFIIDRSGSMSGLRTEKLKKALALFIEALPNDSYFNIINFGSHFNSLLSGDILESLSCTHENIVEALERIKTIEADFGGTEILQPIKAVLSLKGKIEYPKFLFLLTDGDVGNSDEVVNTIKKMLGFSRIYSIGIGNGVSTSLIKRIALFGKGKHEFVKDDDNLEEKTIRLLHNAVSPYAKNIEIKFNKPEFLGDNYPKIDSNDILIKNEMGQYFIFLRNVKDFEDLKNLEIRVIYENSFTEKKEEFLLDFSSMQIIENSDVLHKFAIQKKISMLSEELSLAANKEKEDIIIKDSIKFQVLSKYTAFITVIQENDFDCEIKRKKINIDNIMSNDYLKDDLSMLTKKEKLNMQYPKIHLAQMTQGDNWSGRNMIYLFLFVFMSLCLLLS